MMEVLATQFDQLQSKLYGWIFSREPSTLVYKNDILRRCASNKTDVLENIRIHN